MSFCSVASSTLVHKVRHKYCQFFGEGDENENQNKSKNLAGNGGIFVGFRLYDCCQRWHLRRYCRSSGLPLFLFTLTDLKTKNN